MKTADKGSPLPKFGEWDVNDPASAEGFTVIFNKARDEKKTGGKPESPTKADSNLMHGANPIKPQPEVPPPDAAPVGTYHFSYSHHLSSPDTGLHPSASALGLFIIEVNLLHDFTPSLL
ncbi:RPM1-interacting protein 4 (RIN4) family protein [Actinidia rufa]|uniref:RPM1-interacting protein 4 (RIN4) family protein n=1 Tax=Actinidia rufa TaxID=165716 RepID=A0A7J0DY80_9ERIC|nr:RPM1-interacting protein 4 (RIN4) family protein [Actinidia rufa]